MGRGLVRGQGVAGAWRGRGPGRGLGASGPAQRSPRALPCPEPWWRVVRFTRAGPRCSGCLCGRVRVRRPRARPGGALGGCTGGLDGSPAGSLMRPQPQPQPRVRQPRVRGDGGCHAEAPGSLREGHRESGKLRAEWTQPRPGWGSPLKPEGGGGEEAGAPRPGRDTSRWEHPGPREESKPAGGGSQGGGLGWGNPVRGQVRRRF